MKIWICEMQQAAFDVYRWLCKPCALARRKEQRRGMPIWLAVVPLRQIEAGCEDCYRREHANDPDDAAELRKSRAATREPDRLVRLMVAGKLIERRAGDFAVMPNAEDA